MNRRNFISAILATATAPAFVRAESLMRVRSLEGWITLPSGVLVRDLDKFRYGYARDGWRCDPALYLEPGGDAVSFPMNSAAADIVSGPLTPTKMQALSDGCAVLYRNRIVTL